MHAPEMLRTGLKEVNACFERSLDWALQLPLSLEASSNGNNALEAAAEERQRQTSNVVPGHAATDLNARFASVRRDREYILSKRENSEQQPPDHSEN